MKVIKAEDTRSLEPFRDRIIKGDCLEVMKDIPGESIDMILCDLPYGTTQNKWDSIIDLDLLFTEYMRIIKPHGAIAARYGCGRRSCRRWCDRTAGCAGAT